MAGTGAAAPTRPRQTTRPTVYDLERITAAFRQAGQQAPSHRDLDKAMRACGQDPTQNRALN